MEQETKPGCPFITGVISLYFTSLWETELITGSITDDEWIASVLRVMGCFGYEGWGSESEKLK